jgi:hypothetical protein
MKELVENMLKPSLFNWMDLLRAAELLNLKNLKSNVMNFLKDNSHVLHLDSLTKYLTAENLVDSEDDVSDDEEEGDKGDPQGKKDKKLSKGKSQETTSKLEKREKRVLKQLKEEFPTLFEEVLLLRSKMIPFPPSNLLIEEGKLTKDKGFSDEKKPFPIWGLTIAGICLYLYQHATQILPIGPIVPFVNVLGLLMLVGYGFRVLSK